VCSFWGLSPAVLAECTSKRMRTDNQAYVAEFATSNAYGVFFLEIPPGSFRASSPRMNVDLPALEALRERVIGGAIAVHRELGPGLLESIYRDCLVIELEAAGLRVEREHCVCLHYRGERVSTALRIDLLVENQLVIEIKAVESLHPVHTAQVITYLKLSGLPFALLINFNVTRLTAGLKRLVHPELFMAQRRHRADAVGAEIVWAPDADK
jgi:GxxExxY protein